LDARRREDRPCRRIGAYDAVERPSRSVTGRRPSSNAAGWARERAGHADLPAWCSVSRQVTRWPHGDATLAGQSRRGTSKGNPGKIPAVRIPGSGKPSRPVGRWHDRVLIAIGGSSPSDSARGGMDRAGTVGGVYTEYGTNAARYRAVACPICQGWHGGRPGAERGATGPGRHGRYSGRKGIRRAVKAHGRRAERGWCR